MTEVASRLTFLEERLLLEESSHRIKNELASLISAVNLAVRRTKNDEVKAALAGVAKNIHHYADIHRALQMPDGDARVDAQAYLRNLCSSISRAKLEHLKIELALAANPIQLLSGQCWRLGMIVYELVTNAARHAFSESPGEIRVELFRAGRHVACRVLDNGSAASGVQRGRGLRIVDELTKDLDGHFAQRFGIKGSLSVVAFPYSWECEARQREEPGNNGAGQSRFM